MKLSEYFTKAKGVGVLATTDAAGQVDQAIYAKPLFLDKDDNGTCSLVISNRLSHDNVEHNPSAAFLFLEAGDGFTGKRLSLVLINEELDAERIKAIRQAATICPSARRTASISSISTSTALRPLIGNE